MLELTVRLFRKWRPLEGWLLWAMALITLLMVPPAAESAAWVPFLGPMLAVIVLLGYWAGFGLTRRQVKADGRAAEKAGAKGATGHPRLVGRDHSGGHWPVDGVAGGRLARGVGRAGGRALDTWDCPRRPAWPWRRWSSG